MESMVKTSPGNKNKRQKGRISLYPLDPEEAMRLLLEVKPSKKKKNRPINKSVADR
jgi:hypothetical protein